MIFVFVKIGETVQAKFDGEWRTGCKVTKMRGKYIYVSIPGVLDDVYGLNLLKEGEDIPVKQKPETNKSSQTPSQLPQARPSEAQSSQPENNSEPEEPETEVQSRFKFCFNASSDRSCFFFVRQKKTIHGNENLLFKLQLLMP